MFIQPRDLGLAAVEGQPQAAQGVQPVAAVEGRAALRASGKLAEYQHVLDTIRRFGGHKTKAAESLGMTPRALRYRLNAMREQGLQVQL
ncbi:Bacterial regulatory protein, Fis family [compost metagenome]